MLLENQQMYYTNKKLISEPVLCLENYQIVRKESVKYLGIHIDDKLKSIYHLVFVKKKLAQLCGITYHLRTFLSLRISRNY